MSKKEELLKAAELKVRSGGYNNFSFRELATEVGIKSASVHYHFPTKSDLGAALAHQYTEEFLKALGDPDELYAAGKNPIDVYINLFRKALVKDKKMCLCGLLGAESDSLPDKVLIETKLFFERNIAWLTQAHTVIAPDNKEAAKRNAIKTIAILEGVMLISKTLDDNQIFEEAILGLGN
ncbi:TetR/AcrR family transcriptional regulator [Colwellia psychrerythraea]|uniref:Transcriptional regulator, TetR family n=1 Tax=Colwellia psychrerythraea TaxID=28229 RepID=A0A099L515_COLPS|nr:TetR/AcrR family transcriptional regulator [Colwellia psychrerythraea]KGJ97515.1 transcriptional regulator, TetR family [Colwellia psychrerythraea]